MKLARPLLTNHLVFLARPLHCGQYDSFWIDYVCIKQRSMHEKSWQVSRVRKIYSRAQKVIIWLGEHAEDSELAIESIIANKRQSLRLLDTNCQEAMLHLIRRQVWAWIWVVQEVMLAKDVVLFCGVQTFTWLSITGLVSQLRTDSQATASQPDPFRSMMLDTPAVRHIGQKLMWDVLASQGATSLPLKTLLETYGHLGASKI
jgi:hypothetical protein